jgi:hypothetical protein
MIQATVRGDEYTVTQSDDPKFPVGFVYRVVTLTLDEILRRRRPLMGPVETTRRRKQAKEGK